MNEIEEEKIIKNLEWLGRLMRCFLIFNAAQAIFYYVQGFHQHILQVVDITLSLGLITAVIVIVFIHTTCKLATLMREIRKNVIPQL